MLERIGFRLGHCNAQSECDRLISEHYGLIKGLIAFRVGKKQTDTVEHFNYAEMHSAAALALMEAARTWDPSRASFKTWAKRLMLQAIGRAGKKQTKRSSKEISLDAPVMFEDGAGSLHELLPHPDDALAHPGENVDETRENEVALEEVPAELTPREAQIIRRRQDGWKQDDIAAELGVTHQRVSQIEAQIKVRVNALVEHKRKRDRQIPFSSFVDRPPGELPSQARHISDVYPRWWRQQSERGHPEASKRALGTQVSQHRAQREFEPRKYTYLPPLRDKSPRYLARMLEQPTEKKTKTIMDQRWGRK